MCARFRPNCRPHQRFALIIAAAALLSGALASAATRPPLIARATYNGYRQQLDVVGLFFPSEALVTIADTDTGDELDTFTSSRLGRFRQVVNGVSAAPRSITLTCEEMTLTHDVRQVNMPAISSAYWSVHSKRLAMRGRSFPANSAIQIYNAVTDAPLGSTTANKVGVWRFQLYDVAVPPCSIRVEASPIALEADVRGAYPACNGPVITGNCAIVAFNDLGMHCYDSDYSVLSILPPFNVIHAQVVCRDGSATPTLLDDSAVYVTYRAVRDNLGSITTTSAGRTNFWTYITQLFGLSRQVDQGILLATMPGVANTPQPFGEYDASHGWFTAPGIPITSTDDGGETNQYPMMRVEAFAKADDQLLASLDIVLPVSDEMHCSSCHDTGGAAADTAAADRWGVGAWSSNPDSELRYRENVLILHDAKHGTDLEANQPVLCASCHYSPALDLAGTGPAGDQIGKPFLSHAIHTRHGSTIAGGPPTAADPAIIPENNTASCYLCHPGSTTQCLRGAMGSNGVACQDCHGGMLAVGGSHQLTDGRTRTPWLDEPKCQSCHTGDAVDHQGTAIRLLTAYVASDPAATPRTATNQRFAEQADTLYRNSHGHGGLACEACHGSPHAIWPVGPANANDNLTSTELQGHAGTLSDCTVCHGSSLALTTNGPHGMHNVNDPNWNRRHESFFRANPDGCKACHGANLEGTVLSRVAADRTLQTDDHGAIFVAKGTPVSCTLCHENPLGGGLDD